MGVDVHMRWQDQTAADRNARGYIRGAGASQVLFAECWEPEILERARKILAGEPVPDPPTITIAFDALVGDGDDAAPKGEDDDDPEIEIFDPENDAASDDFDGDWKPFPAALLRSREKAARRHVWAFAKLNMADRNITDCEEIHRLFLERWLPYKKLIALAERKEAETGKPVEV